MPRLLEKRPGSAPIPLVALGIGLGLLPLGLPKLDPVRLAEPAERLTELGVIVALMGAGLKIDRPLGWRSWATTWRLLAFGMPLTIASVALLGGWVLGLPAATAMLLGASLAPTDPVLASDVQVGEPTVEGTEEAEEQLAEGPEEDEVRFALTSEAGLNDALAFPFTYLAVRFADDGLDPRRWLVPWVTIDLAYRLLAGLVIGWICGKVLARLCFGGRSSDGIATSSEGFVAVAATLVAYGTAELAHGYGFLAVFVAALTLRAAEREHEYHRVLHGFTEQLERLLTVGLLLLLGVCIADGVLGPLGWKGWALAVATVLVLRPAAAWVAMLRGVDDAAERGAIAFFGVRGIGSLYYVAYAVSTAHVEDAGQLWAAVVACITVSIVVHGVAATPVMRRLDRR